GEHGAEAVSIGANVSRQQKSLMTSGEIDKRGPVQWHEGPFTTNRLQGMIIGRVPAEGKSHKPQALARGLPVPSLALRAGVGHSTSRRTTSAKRSATETTSKRGRPSTRR